MNTVFLEKICRCCLNESEYMTNLYDRVMAIESFTFEQNFTYSDLIHLCTNIRCDFDVVDDNEIVELPRNLCEPCLQELKTSFIFRKKVESSNNLLQKQTIGQTVITEEIIELDQTINNSNNDKEKCDDEQRFVVAINEDNSEKNDASNEVQLQIVSVPNLEYQTSNLCRICKKVFHSESDLQAHNRQQHQQYKCNVCSKEFRTQKGFSTHSNSHDEQTNKQKFLCSTCGKFFGTKQRLQAHQSTHSCKMNYVCSACHKRFATESRLRCHQRTHTGEKPFQCNYCDLTFAQGNALRCHKRIHTGERPYQCLICQKRFTQNTILKTHMTLHTGKKIKCPDCDRLFSRRSNLILHRREHTGEKPYACEHCPKRYKQKSHLDQHIGTHLGVKYTCEINGCNKVYSKRWSLKVHMFTHSQVKPHQCTECAAEFTRRDKFKIHLKSVHGLLPTDPNATDSNFPVQNTNE
ncbi:zinc finger protein 813-like [Contarinia nasturtii]|uniref:zinc finger protein 813-like n=1 Tax=Contarinia nasturtii TaxID=265458 RepID=UPI0012D3CC7C|nr:zinc finger protein 813-like [Contarinia nasturtii]